MFGRKRQRRQVAGAAVQALIGSSTPGVTPSGRKSTAQPRPKVQIPPRGIGPIDESGLNPNDVLCGRGGRINSHPGNIQFRDIVLSRKKDYLAESTKKLEKAHIAAKIVSDIRSMEPNGRFLKEDSDSGLWFDIGDAKAIKKAGQALREDAPDIRHEIGDDEKPTENNTKTPEKMGKSSKTSPRSEESEKRATKDTTGRMKKQEKTTVPAGRQPSAFHDAGHDQPAALTPQEIQAQVAMPPPYSHQVLSQQQIVPSMYAAPVRASIPIGPAPSQVQSTYFNGVPPNRVYPSANRSVSGAPKTSRHAMELLAQTPQNDDEAFGRPFAHPPLPPTSVLSAGDHTMSSISGISDPLSSGFGLETGSGVGSRSGSRISGVSSGMRSLGHLRGMLGGGGRSQMPHQYATDHRMQMHTQANAAANSRSDRMSGLSGASLGGRTLSSQDLSAISGESGSAPWLAEGLGDDAILDGMSLSSVSRGRGASGASIMSASLASMSVGSASSGQWQAGAPAADDGRSILSDMSADLYALDLADTRR